MFSQKGSVYTTNCKTQHCVCSPGKSHSRAEWAAWRDILPLGSQLLHGFQPRQWVPCWLSFWDHVHPCFPLYWAQHHQLLWDDPHRPQRGHLLVAQVRRSLGFCINRHSCVLVPDCVSCAPSRMHLALKAYQELLLTVNEMDQSQDENIRQSSSIIKSKSVPTAHVQVNLGPFSGHSHSLHPAWSI